MFRAITGSSECLPTKRVLKWGYNPTTDWMRVYSQWGKIYNRATIWTFEWGIPAAELDSEWG